jgi:hypothetical protein
MSDTVSHPQEPSDVVQEKRKHDYLAEIFSLRVAITIGADPNTCFDNTWRMFIQYFPEIFKPHGSFLEGWWVIDLPDQVVMNEHGWAEFPDGTIVDPTVVLLVDPDTPIYYFPGVTRTWEEVEALVQAEKWFPYVRFGAYGEDGLGHPGYKAAHDAAKQKLLSLANATYPPKQMHCLSAHDLEDQHAEECELHIIIISPDEDEKSPSAG